MKKMLLALTMGLIFSCSNNQKVKTESMYSYKSSVKVGDRNVSLYEYKASDNNTYLIASHYKGIAIIRLEK